MALVPELGFAEWINDIMVIIACVHNLALLIYHIYHILECFTKIKTTNLQRLSLVTISMQLIFAFWIILNDWDIRPFSCKGQVICASILYVTTKTTLYILFVERLFAVFSNSPLAFKTVSIVIVRILYTLWLLFMIINPIILGNGHYDEDTGSCKSGVPLWMNSLGAMIDILSCSIISIMFARRLLTLALTASPKLAKNNSSDSNDTNNTNDNKIDIYDAVSDESVLMIVLRKATLLTIIGLFTTPLSLILLSIFGLGGMWISMDTMINCWCVMLMFSPYKKLYKRLCCRMDACLTIRCLSCYSCYCCCKIKTQELPSTSMQKELPSIANDKSPSPKSNIQMANT